MNNKRLVPVKLKDMGIKGELGSSTYPASRDTSMAAFNSKIPTRGYMFAYSRCTHTRLERVCSALWKPLGESFMETTPDNIFMVDQLKTIQETQTDTHRAIRYHYKRGQLYSTTGTMRKRLHKYASHSSYYTCNICLLDSGEMN